MSNRSCVVRSDLATDPFQVTNIYDSQSAAMKAELASELRSYWHCTGAGPGPNKCP